MAVRRVRRILRRIDPWTVLKVSLVFNAIAALVFVLGMWVTWSMALRRGIPDRVVDIVESLTLTLTVEGELYFRIIVLLAIIGAILLTAFMTLGAVLYNLIADLVGGIEIAVLEETYRPQATRTTLSPAPEAAPALSPAIADESKAPDGIRAPGPSRQAPTAPGEGHPPGTELPLASAARVQAATPSAPAATQPEGPDEGTGLEVDSMPADGVDVSRVRAG